MKFTWKQFSCIKEFERSTLSDLLFNEYQNSIILKILKRNSSMPIGDSVRLVTVSNQSGNVLIGVQTLPHQMLWYFCRDKYNEAALEFYIDKVIENGWDLHQIQGDEKSAKRFAQIYAQKTGKSFHNRENLVVYRLEKLCPKPNVAGGFRTATLDDMNVLPFWSAAFYKECGLEQTGHCLDWQHETITKNFDARARYLWEMNGRQLSMASLTKISDETASIGGVYTPPHFRGNGFAFGLV